ncbi:hypothetical protein V5O48_005814 [Marasmius crinis-equi]|uniref:lipoate--protein ligase n=1 Tax=Marasmius crinis-equi TaxID=585013 RepID=A0ABR3FLB7_9AGAR
MSSHTTQDTMETKGVASVRSPVCNLQQFSTEISHKTFVDAVVQEFQKEYDVVEDVNPFDDQTQIISQRDMQGLDYIERGMAELRSWEWAYGQTPEFTYSVSHEFRWGTADAKFRSKHGLVLECDLHVSNEYLAPTDVKEIQQLLLGKRYGSISGEELGETLDNSRISELWAWLQDVMVN